METLFGFTGDDLKETYPEISECEEFQKLKKEELIFTWYFANKTSPYFMIGNKTKRVLKCLPILREIISDEDMERYVDLKFPAYLQNAIQRMEQFDPALRSIAKTMTGQIVDTLRKAVSEDIKDYTEASDKKQFVDMCINIGKNLPDLIKSLERGYGITQQKVKQIEEVTFDNL